MHRFILKWQNSDRMTNFCSSIETRWGSDIFSTSFYHVLFICILLSLAIIIIYWQVVNFDFIVFDDHYYVTNNDIVKEGITFEGIKWAFTSIGYSANWHPLSWISHMLDIQFFGMNPGMHHFTNVIFHVFNTVLLFLVLERMTGALWRSAAVAALFALHPLHVESVAWISERKDVLSTFFWMLTMMGYIWYVEHRNMWRYLLVVFLYILGLLSKPMLVTLPFILLLLDFWPLNRLGFDQTGDIGKNHGLKNKSSEKRWSRLLKLILEKIPIIVLAIISSLMTIVAQGKTSSIQNVVILTLGTRLLNAITSYVAYLLKVVYFFNLAVFYPYNFSFNPFLVIGCTLFLILITFFVILFAKRLPYLLVGWLWYLGALIPVIGIVQVGDQSMADRYTYIPLVGIFIMIVWGIWEMLHQWKYRKAIIRMFSIIILIILMIATFYQVSFWKNSGTLFNHTLKVTKNNYVAYNSLGVYLFDKGDLEGSRKQFKLAIQVNPYYALAYNNLGKSFFAEKRYTEALGQFHECLKIKPDYGDTYKSIGDIMLLKENYDRAIVNYKKALQISSSQAKVYYHLGIAYFQKSNYSKAVECFQEAINENPLYSEAISYLREAKSAQTNLDNLILSIKATIKTDPQNLILHMKLGDLYHQECEYENAIAQYQEVLSIQPQYIPAFYRLALIYSEKNDYASAINKLQKIRDMQPNNPEIYYNMACIYAKQNMVDESIKWLKQSVDKGFHNWVLLEEDPDLENIKNTFYVLGLLKNYKT